MSKKGFYEVLVFVSEKGSVGYADILKYCLEGKIVQSRGTVPTILNGLTDLGLLERTVSTERPVRTRYSLTEKGKRILELLNKIAMA